MRENGRIADERRLEGADRETLIRFGEAEDSTGFMRHLVVGRTPSPFFPERGSATYLVTDEVNNRNDSITNE